MARKRPLPAPEPAANLAGLVQACKDDPDDDGLRLILADYLADHGEPERAEFLRLCVGHIGARELGRMARLRQANDPTWLGTVPSKELQVGYGREGVHVRTSLTHLNKPAAKAWLAERSPWVESLQLHVSHISVVTSLVKSSAVRNFTRLKLSGLYLSATDTKALATSPLAESLRALSLKNQYQSGGACRSLFASDSCLRNLRLLTIEGGFTYSEAKALTRAPLASGLHALTLPSRDVTAAHLAILSEGLPSLRRLRLDSRYPLTEMSIPEGLAELHVNHVDLSESAIVSLAGSPRVASLDRLTLANVGLTDAGARALAESPHLSNLRGLYIPGHRLEADGIRALAASHNFSRLESLDLSPSSPRDRDELLPMLQSESFPALKNLTIGGVNGSSQFISALLQGPLASRLRFLKLTNTINPQEVALLAASPALKNLEGLNLESCRIDATGLLALARSTTLDRLIWLSAAGEGNCDAGLAELAHGSGLPALTFLRFSDRGVRAIQPEIRTALQQSPRRLAGFFVDLDGLVDLRGLWEIHELGLEMDP